MGFKFGPVEKAQNRQAMFLTKRPVHNLRTVEDWPEHHTMLSN